MQAWHMMIRADVHSFKRPRIATTSAEAFLNWDTIKIVGLGLAAFIFGTAAGVLNQAYHDGYYNGEQDSLQFGNRTELRHLPNFLLRHAMGPNVAGVIGTAVAAGTFMAIYGVF